MESIESSAQTEGQSQVTESSPSDSSSEPSGNGGIFERFFDRILGRNQSESNEDGPAEDQSGETNQDGQQQDSDTVTMSRAEMAEQIRRESQSLKDREILNDLKVAALRAADENDPDALVELARKRPDQAGFVTRELAKRGFTWETGQLTVEAHREDIATQQSTHQIRTIAEQFDDAILTPVLHALPEDVQDRLMRTIDASGLEGRTALTQGAIKELQAISEKNGHDKAMSKLRADPVFRKELLIEMRGGDSYSEPDLVGSSSSSSSAPGAEAFLRGLF